MKLQAVTICINYSDYLEAISDNRKHFDRWIVMTCKNDVETHRLCNILGIECYNSKMIQGDGRDFNAAYNKATLINEALDLLDQQDWAVVLDSDILLPRYFRERVNALPLHPGALYGLSGRRVVTSRRKFEMIREIEPWDRLLQRNSQPIGYFNLFHLEHYPNRYPTSPITRNGVHDDWLFTESFPTHLRQVIPLTAIHTGPINSNWTTRVSAPFAQEKQSEDIEILQVLPQHIKRESTLAVLGYYPGGKWLTLADGFRHTYLVDHYKIHTDSKSAILDADRSTLRSLLQRDVSLLKNTTYLAHSVQDLEKIDDRSIDVLYLTGEVLFDWLSHALPYWNTKLKSGAIICGDLYGLPEWPNSTRTVCLLLGTPQRVTSDGFWSVVYTPPEETLAFEASFAASENLAVVIVCHEKDDFQLLNTTLYSLRQHWTGETRLFHWGKEDPSLHILCSLLNIKLQPIDIPPGITSERDVLFKESSSIHPFQKAIFLFPGIVVTGPIFNLFGPRPLTDFTEPSSPQLVSLSGGKMLFSPLVCASASSYSRQSHTSCSLVDCSSESEIWSHEAWELWMDVTKKITLALSRRVRIPKDSMVVCFIDKNNLHYFTNNALTWNFDDDVPIVLLLIDLERSTVENLLTKCPNEIIELSSGQDNSILDILRTISDVSHTEHVIFIPAEAYATAGAELWMGEYWNSIDAALDDSIKFPGVESIETDRVRPFFGIAKWSFLRSRDIEKKKNSFLTKPIVDQLASFFTPETAVLSNVGLWGWKFTSREQSVQIKNRSLASEGFNPSLHDFPGGVGTELKKYLARLGIRDKPTCRCKDRAFLMDKRGILWCEDNVTQIAAWLKEEADKRKLPFNTFLAHFLIKKAIRSAKKLQKQQVSNGDRKAS